MHRFEQLVRVGVLLQVKERIYGDGLELRHPLLKRLAHNKQRRRDSESVVKYSGLLQKTWGHIRSGARLHVVANQHDTLHTAPQRCRTGGAKHILSNTAHATVCWRSLLIQIQ